MNQIGRSRTGEVVVSVEPRYWLLEKVKTVLDDQSKARKKECWTFITTLYEPVAEMEAYDGDQARREVLMRLKGVGWVGSRK